MKHGKKIEFKTEKMQTIVYGFRRLIIRAVLERKSRIRKKISHLLGKPSGLRQRFHDKIDALREKEFGLDKALDNSICICPGCGRADRVMVYNQKLEQWWCEPCFNDRADFYNEMKPAIDAGSCVGDFDVEFHKTFLLDEGMNSRP
jgi:hypothetical protein